MYAAERSILWHRALTARVQELQERLAAPGWSSAPDGLRQARVASRRVRAVLDLADPERYPAHARQARKLRKLTRALGRPRELQMHAHLLETLRARLAGPGALCALDHALERLRVEGRKARASMERDLNGFSLKGLGKLLDAFRPDKADPSGASEPWVWACLEPWVETALAPLPGLLEVEDATALHQARIRVKRLRYALEILGPGLAVEPLVQLRYLKALQQALGSHHDLATLEAWLLELKGSLLAHQRLALAAGCVELLALVAQARRGAFEQCQALGHGTSKEAFCAGLRPDLDHREGDPSL